MPPLGFGTDPARRPSWRYRRDHGAQHPGAARGALRGTGAGRGAECAQRAARRANDRILPRSWWRARTHHGSGIRANGQGGAARDRASCWSSTSTIPKGPVANDLVRSRTKRCSRQAIRRSSGRARRTRWDSLSLLYTSGTTGDPKGVVYHHRGAYLNALGNALAFRLDADSVYLWTLPMFHCNGWTYTWAVTAAGGTHVCLRRVLPEHVFAAIRDHRVTHLCGAPIVLNMLIHAPAEVKAKFDHVVDVATGGARRRRPSSKRWSEWAFASRISTD